MNFDDARAQLGLELTDKIISAVADGFVVSNGDDEREEGLRVLLTCLLAATLHAQTCDKMKTAEKLSNLLMLLLGNTNKHTQH